APVVGRRRPERRRDPLRGPLHPDAQAAARRVTAGVWTDDPLRGHGGTTRPLPFGLAVAVVVGLALLTGAGAAGPRRSAVVKAPPGAARTVTPRWNDADHIQ